MVKFRGELSELQAHVTALGYKGQWGEDINGKQFFRSEDGAVMNWWPSTGTLQFQGPFDARTKLQDAVSKALSGDTMASEVTVLSEAEVPSQQQPSVDGAASSSTTVFVVYGHDDTAREQLELILRRLDLHPFVLGNTGGGGRTIIEALEREITSRESDLRFGIVLLTPDDMGYKRGTSPDTAVPRARQNVVMEMGMLIAAIGRPRVAILKKGSLEVPSDVSGILYLAFNDHVRETVPRLCDRLREAGFELSAQSITAAAA